MVYNAGTQMIINTALTMQHFCQEIEAGLKFEFEGGMVGQRIREALQRASLAVTTSDRGYSALREMLERRDAIEHPKRENVLILTLITGIWYR